MRLTCGAHCGPETCGHDSARLDRVAESISPKVEFIAPKPSAMPAHKPVTNGIKCGRCKEKHPTVLDVRKCFADAGLTVPPGKRRTRT